MSVPGVSRPKPEAELTTSPFAYERDPAAISAQSFRCIAEEVDFSAMADCNRPLATRMIHACGMTGLICDIVATDEAGSAGRQALVRGAPLLCDSRMVAAGIMASRLPMANDIVVGLDQPGCTEHAREIGNTRSAAGIALMADRFRDGILVVGNAPTALFHALELIASGAGRPALIIGAPVGFIGAAESKEALIASDLELQFITVRGRRGGSAIAAAAVNALAVS